jgi:hypothetical protein
MVQTHSQLQTTCDQYNSFFAENELCLLQKAYTTPHFLTLSIRFPGKTVVLYIGRGNQYQGIFLADKMPPSHLRIQDRFLDYVRKNIVGTKLSKIHYNKNKMLIFFEFRKEGVIKEFHLGWNDRHLYFDQQRLDDQGDFAMPNESNHTRPLLTLEDYLKSKNFDESKKVVQKKKEKFLHKKIENIKKDIEKNMRWKLIEEKLAAETIDLNGIEVVVCGEKIKFPNCKNEWQKKDQIYKKIKKLRKGEELQLIRLKETEMEQSKAKSGVVEFVLTKEVAIQPCWPNQKISMKNDQLNANVKQIMLGKIAGVVGLDSSGNDFIRNGEKKDYYWFHLENLKGAHCILKTDDISQLGQIELSAIASMLRDLSHLEILEVPVLFTQLKNIKGIKGAQGSVTVKKGKHLRCNYINWKEIITI